MTFKTSLLTTVAVLAATPVFAQDDARVAQFRTLIANNNCTMTEQFAETFLPTYGFNQDETRAIAGMLINSGSASFENGAFNLLDGACATDGAQQAGGPLTDQQQRFINILATNNCAADENEVQAIFPANGMDANIAFEIGEGLMDSGIATVTDDGKLIVSSQYCGNGAGAALVSADVTPAQAAALALPNATQFTEIMAQYNCVMSEADAETVFPENGMSKDQVGALVGAFINAGMADFDRATKMLSVSEQFCGAPVETPVELPPANTGGFTDQPDVQEFIRVVSANNCQLIASEVIGAFSSSSLATGRVFEVANQLVSQGHATMEAGVITVSPEVCQGQAEALPQQNGDDQQLLANTELLRQYVSANNCWLPHYDRAAGVDEIGLTVTESMAAMMALIALGEADSKVSAVLTNGVSDTHLNESTLCTFVTRAPHGQPPAQSSGGGNLPDGLAGRADVETFLTVMTANNCAVSAGAMASVFAEQSIDGAAAFQIANEMVTMGLAQISGADLVVSDTLCPYQPGAVQQVNTPVNETPATPQTDPNDPLVGLVSVFAQYDCSIGAADMSTAFADGPIDVSTAFAMSNDLISQGLAQIEGANMVLSSSICPPQGGAQVVEMPQTPVEQPMQSDRSPEELEFIRVAELTGCAIAASDMNSAFANASIDGAAAFSVANDMMASGEASVENNILVIAQTSCPLGNGVAVAQETPEAPGNPILARDDVQGFLTVLAGNNCSLAAADFYTAFANGPIDGNAAFAIVNELVAMDLASTADNNLSVSSDICPPTGNVAQAVSDRDAADAEMLAMQQAAAAMEAEMIAEAEAAVEAQMIAAAQAAEAAAEAEMMDAAEGAVDATVQEQPAAEQVTRPELNPSIEPDAPVFSNPNIANFIDFISANNCTMDYRSAYERDDEYLPITEITITQLRNLGVMAFDSNYDLFVTAPYCEPK